MPLTLQDRLQAIEVALTSVEDTFTAIERSPRDLLAQLLALRGEVEVLLRAVTAAALKAEEAKLVDRGLPCDRHLAV